MQHKIRIIFFLLIPVLLLTLTFVGCPAIPQPYDDTVPVRGDYSVTGITDSSATINYHLDKLGSGNIYVSSTVALSTELVTITVNELMTQYHDAGAIPGMHVGDTSFMILPDSNCGEALECSGPTMGYVSSPETSAFQESDLVSGQESYPVYNLQPDTWYQVSIMAVMDNHVQVREVQMVFKTKPAP